ncbi:hypothetical protein Aros01_07339 [Streptosporangium roseum]
MIIEVAFSLLRIAIMISAAITAFRVPLLLPILAVVSITALKYRVLSGWLSRRLSVLRCAIAVEVITVVMHLALPLLGGDLRWIKAVDLNTLLPLAVVTLLLTPAAARWFNR